MFELIPLFIAAMFVVVLLVVVVMAVLVLSGKAKLRPGSGTGVDGHDSSSFSD